MFLDWMFSKQSSWRVWSRRKREIVILISFNPLTEFVFPLLLIHFNDFDSKEFKFSHWKFSGGKIRLLCSFLYISACSHGFDFDLCRLLFYPLLGVQVASSFKTLWYYFFGYSRLLFSIMLLKFLGGLMGKLCLGFLLIWWENIKLDCYGNVQLLSTLLKINTKYASFHFKFIYFNLP